jgi:hypothetical protein
MLVLGNGEQVPRSSSRIYDADDVIATIEVKKHLYSKDVVEGVESLGLILDLDLRPSWDYWDSFRNAFRRIVRRPLPYGVQGMPQPYQAIHELIRYDNAFPVRILFGHHGFKSEQTARRALLQLFEERHTQSAFAPSKLPSLILNQHVAIAKLTGAPWYLPMDDTTHSIALMATTGNRSTGTVLLDRIWARLSALGLVEPHYFSPDRCFESWNPLIASRFVGGRGWDMTLYGSRVVPASAKFDRPLEPIPVSENQMIVVMWICATGSLDVGMFEGQSPSPEDILRDLEYLASHGFVGQRWEEPNVWEVLLPATGFWSTPCGDMYIGDNTSGQLTHAGLIRANVEPSRVQSLRAGGSNAGA